MDDVKPILVVISGPARSGKTTLAHELARRVGCPAICRDEIKEGMVHNVRDFVAAPGDELTRRTFPLFFAVLGMLLSEGVTVVAEAAFQDRLWRPNLEPLAEIARLRIVQCHVPATVGRQRMLSRPPRAAHADAQMVDDLASSDRYYDDFERLGPIAPSIDVDTTSGYEPSLDDVVAFVSR